MVLQKRKKASLEELVKVMEKIRYRMVSQSMTRAAADSQDWDLLFRRADKDKTGELQFDEFRGFFRRVLRMPKSDVSDDQLHHFFQELDADGTQAVSMAELKSFLTLPDISEFVQNMRGVWHKDSKHGIVVEIVPEEERMQARELFELYDADHSGLITAPELHKCLQVVGMNPSKAMCDELLAEVPREGADFSTAVKILIRERRKETEAARLAGQKVADTATYLGGSISMNCDLTSAFRLFDEEGDGTLSVDAIREMLTSFGEPLDEEEWTDFESRLRPDKDGRVSYAEAGKSLDLFGSYPMDRERELARHRNAPEQQIGGAPVPAPAPAPVPAPAPAPAPAKKMKA